MAAIFLYVPSYQIPYRNTFIIFKSYD